MKFNIGDTVFVPDFGQKEKWIVCPDCGGTKYITAILHDGTQFQVECGGCDPGGYASSTGYIKQHEWSGGSVQRIVTGVCQHGDKIEYQLDNFGGCSYWSKDESEVFATAEEAFAASEVLRVEREDSENRRFLAKTKDHKTWAWHLHYHRRCIKDAERQIEYHSSKVKICSEKAKEKIA